MGAIDKLAKKLGFVRLDRYGLVHTPDDRILSTRPTVLDDGVGGKIVGWLESDLAAAELERWGAPKEAPRRKIEFPKAAQVIAPLAAPPPPPAPAPKPIAAAPRPLPGVGPVVVAAPAPAPAPVQVAPEPVVEEDDWEWEIAVARARAEALDAAAAPAPQPAPARTPRVTSQPFAAAKKPEPLPKLFTTTSTPGTVIPVPALPTASNPAMVRPAVVASPKRFPKATGRVEDTIVTKAAPPANDDTQPSIVLPRAASTVGLPSSKRVAAKQR